MSEKISDERLEHHIRWFASEVEPPVEPESVGLDDYELLSLLRELRAYRTYGKFESFVELLDAEIERQKNLIERMDNHPDINTGIMGNLRAEKLELMTRLREFYREERP